MTVTAKVIIAINYNTNFKSKIYNRAYVNNQKATTAVTETSGITVATYVLSLRLICNEFYVVLAFKGDWCHLLLLLMKNIEPHHLIL